ncbi:MAG: phospho-N-acetylmuramoyl-pentapeptide-transferase [Firmicutes bacterium]|nr:phospho-N-acetylmuramoyl-pentapeptide-transferase [Bacillota bacterium]
MPPLKIFLAMLLSFAISVAICPLFILLIRRLQLGQQIRADGPRRHLSKAGTPTMGGIVFLFSSVVSLLLVAPRSPLLLIALFVTLGNALIGWLDDYANVSLSRSLGLRARDKLFGQLIIALILILVLFKAGFSTGIMIPFAGVELQPGLLYPLLVPIIIIATTNGVNLTDGIDGLATGTAIIALLGFLYIALTAGLPEVALFCGTLVGGCFGFLVYNMHPARIFMGDTGSLALGGALAVAAILTKTELYLVIIGGVFVIETLSVILQVASFQLTGKRIFLMAPLHHHFEMKGWSEWQVVTGFWGLTFLFTVIALIDLGWG